MKRYFIDNGLLILLIFVIFIGITVSIMAVFQLSLTQDEDDRLSSGLSYWTHHEVRMYHEHSPFSKLLATSPVFLWFSLGQIHFDEQAYISDKLDDTYKFTNHFRDKNDFLKMTKISRLSSILAYLFVVLMIFKISNRLFKKEAAYYSSILSAISPTILAYSSVFAHDIFYCLAWLIFIYYTYLWIVDRSLKRVIILGLATGFLCLNHFSCIVFPLVLFLALIGDNFFNKRVNSFQRTIFRNDKKQLLYSVLLILIITFVVTWSGYFFQTGTILSYSKGKMEKSQYVYTIIQEPKLAAKMVKYINKTNLPMPSFFLGVVNSIHKSTLKNNDYFCLVRSFCSKLSALEIICFMLGMFMLIKMHKKCSYRGFFLLSILFFMVILIISNPQTSGIKYGIVIVALLFIAAGFGISEISLKYRKTIFTIAVIYQLGLLLFWHPNYLSFVNELFFLKPIYKIGIKGPDLNWGQGNLMLIKKITYRFQNKKVAVFSADQIPIDEYRKYYPQSKIWDNLFVTKNMNVVDSISSDIIAIESDLMDKVKSFGHLQEIDHVSNVYFIYKRVK